MASVIIRVKNILRRLIYTYLTDQEYLIDLHILSKKIDFSYNNITDYTYESFFQRGAVCSPKCRKSSALVCNGADW